MSSNDELLSVDIDGPDPDSLNENIESTDRQEALAVARIWAFVVLVGIAFLSFFYALVSSLFDFRLSSYWHVGRVVAWLWVNCGAIGLGIWSWKNGRFPIADRKWLRGRRLILTWFATSLAWFMLPVVLKDAWDIMSAWLTKW
ncbi:MAG: hypothetical protein P0Y64_16465 [Candidatus Sphingomonas colombiensis]|nr:hypothetical protein [Sphingomonas sp.]WEK42917.1 MAG: hypothetical protein P0Y64_16465 [Sphingomonas sp.]